MFYLYSTRVSPEFHHNYNTSFVRKTLDSCKKNLLPTLLKKSYNEHVIIRMIRSGFKIQKPWIDKLKLYWLCLILTSDGLDNYAFKQSYYPNLTIPLVYFFLLLSFSDDVLRLGKKLNTCNNSYIFEINKIKDMIPLYKLQLEHINLNHICSE